MSRVAPLLLGPAAVLAAALWAFAPLPDTPSTNPVAPLNPPEKNTPPSDGPLLALLDRSAFHAPLWIAPPTPPPSSAPAPPAPLPPLKLQLLAIIKENGDETPLYKAMVYDPDLDKVFVVGAGESLAGRTVESIDQSSLRIKDAHGARVLALKNDEKASAVR